MSQVGEIWIFCDNIIFVLHTDIYQFTQFQLGKKLQLSMFALKELYFVKI